MGANKKSRWMFAKPKPARVQYPGKLPTVATQIQLTKRKEQIREWAIQQVDAALRQNPRQIPSGNLARQTGYSTAVLITLAKVRRKEVLKLKHDSAKGGARIKYPSNIMAMVQKASINASRSRRAINLRELIIEIAKKTGILISPGVARHFADYNATAPKPEQIAWDRTATSKQELRAELDRRRIRYVEFLDHYRARNGRANYNS